MWMLLPMTLSVVFTLLMVPNLGRSRDWNKRIRVLAEVPVVGTDGDAVAFSQNNKSDRGAVPESEIRPKSQLGWASEVFEVDEGRFELTWLWHAGQNSIRMTALIDHHALTKQNLRPGTFWSQYSSSSSTMFWIGSIVGDQT